MSRDAARVAVLLGVNGAIVTVAVAGLYTIVALVAGHSLMALWIYVAAHAAYTVARVAYIRRNVTAEEGDA